MKTRFVINDEVFGVSGMHDGSLEECKKYYERLYEKAGFVFDLEAQECYKDFNREIYLKEGDRVDLSGYRIVTDKCIDLDNDIIIYQLEVE